MTFYTPLVKHMPVNYGGSIVLMLSNKDYTPNFVMIPYWEYSDPYFAIKLADFFAQLYGYILHCVVHIETKTYIYYTTLIHLLYNSNAYDGNIVVFFI